MSSTSSSQQDVTSIFRLPDSVWEGIICRLRTHQRAKLRGANRKFRTLVNNTVKKVKLDPTYSADAVHWQLHSRFPSLEHIEIMKPSDVDYFTDQAFSQLALKDMSRLPSLASCNLENCTQLTVAGMAALALACPRIGRLVIPQVCQLCMSDGMLLVLARLPELSKLRLQCCKHCDEVALAYLSDLKHLTALELEDYGQALRQVTQLTSLTSLRSVMVWSDYVVDVLDGNEPHLGHHPPHGLMHGGMGGGMGGVHGPHGGAAAGGMAGGGAVIHHHPQGGPTGPAAALQGMNPIMAAAEAAAAAAAVANLNLLQHAEAAAAAAAGAAGGAVGGGPVEEAAVEGLDDDIDDDGGGAGAGEPAAVLAAALQNVDAAFVHQLQITEQVLNNIFEGKAALLSWVTGMTGLTHVDIQRVDISGGELQRFTALTGLIHLGVGDLNLDINLKGFELDPPRPLPSVTKLVSHNILYEAHLRTTFPSLKALSCDSADSGLIHIAELTGLVNLFLWNSPSSSISDSGLARLSVLRLLETFRLEGSSAVTDNGWVEFAAAHNTLTRIDLVKCPSISDIGFILSIRDLSRLERVSFAECPLIDTRTLAALLAFCPKLTHLELQDCSSISLASLRNLLSTATRPDLELVYRKGGSMRALYCGR